MLYNITPEQEKAALNEVLAELIMRHHYFYNNDAELLLKASSLAEVISNDNIYYWTKIFIVCSMLEHITFTVFSGETKFYYNYKNFKSLYEKYSNQDLFGVINGLSVSHEDLNKLILDASSMWINNLLISSMFFSFCKESSEFHKAFERYLSNTNIDGNPVDFFAKHGLENEEFLLLLPFRYKFTEDTVQEDIRWNQYSNPGGMIFFAASPYTKQFLTKTNFAEEYKSLIIFGNAYGEKNTDSVKDLSIAYQDLFNEDFTPVALEAIKELDIKEFDSKKLDTDDFQAHLNLLDLNHTPYSDDHYKNMVSCYRNHSYLHYPECLKILAKSSKTKDLIIRQDFTDCLNNNENNNDYYDKFFINELSQAYQELFHEELVIDTESL